MDDYCSGLSANAADRKSESDQLTVEAPMPVDKRKTVNELED